MHELHVTQQILEIALRHADEAKRITDIYLVIGQLSSFVDDSIQFYWDMLSKDTIAVGAQLHFRRIPAEMLCKDCQQRHRLDSDFACPNCGGVNLQVVAGDEFYVEAIDVEQYEEFET